MRGSERGCCLQAITLSGVPRDTAALEFQGPKEKKMGTVFLEEVVPERRKKFKKKEERRAWAVRKAEEALAEAVLLLAYLSLCARVLEFIFLHRFIFISHFSLRKESKRSREKTIREDDEEKMRFALIPFQQLSERKENYQGIFLFL